MDTFSRNWPDVRVEDVLFVTGNSSTTRGRWESLRKARWYKKVVGVRRWMPTNFALSEVYVRHCLTYKREPTWMKRLSPDMRRDIRHFWLTGDYFDPLWIINYRHGLGFSFAVHADEMVHDVSVALNVFRLGNIRQLGFLHDPVVNDDTANIGLAESFHHTRLLHSSTVMATAALIAHQIDLPKGLTRNLMVASLTHDIRTPAGGDSVKPIDPSGLDEDAHYGEAFQDNPEWVKVSRRYGLDETVLTRTVAGKGILGQLLDIADKTTYVDHDVDAYLKWNNPKKFRNLVPPPGFIEIWNLHQKLGQKACRLWDCVAIIDGRVVITDAQRLEGFLRLRALMFKHLYFNPRARYREQMLALLILEPLYREGKLTREMLLEMGDNNLWDWLNRTVQSDIREHLSHSHLAPKIESFRNQEEALRRLRTLHAHDSSLLFMLETFPQPNKKAVQMLVRGEGGIVRSFAEVCPRATAEILALGDDPEPVKLYILEAWKVAEVIPKDLQTKLYTCQQERFGLE